MKKGNLLLLIITLLIIAIVIVFSLIVIKGKNKPVVLPTPENNVDNEIKEVTDKVDYYVVKNCVNKFYKYYATMFDSREDADKEKTFTLLDEEYINFVGASTDNMLTIFQRQGDVVTNIENMWVSQQSDNVYAYIVNGQKREKMTNEISNFQMIIKIDTKNNTFSVILEDYIQMKYKNINLGDKLEIDSIKDIPIDRYNLCVVEEITDMTYVKDLFNDYKEELLYNQELAFEHLDIEYRTNKFGTIGKFKEFAEANKARDISMEITQYQKTENNENNQYICIDQYGRYYIFREIGIMKYSLLLDTYTIDLPEFLQKYNAANTVERVGYNIQKCIDAINYKDYSYVYDKLDLEFKAINYVVIEKFEKEIKDNLFAKNEVKKVSSYSEGSTYAYKLVITDADDNTKEQKMTVIMQLKEGTDFVMSFSFEK